MGKFYPLTNYLSNITEKNLVLSFSEIERIISEQLCYSAYTITKLQSIGGWVLFGIVWSVVLVGILFYAISGRKYENLNMILYIVAGFSGLVVARNLYQVL